MMTLTELPVLPLPVEPLLAACSSQVLVVHHGVPAFATPEHLNPFPQVCIKLGQAHQQTETVQGRTRTSVALPGNVGLYPANLQYSFAWDREAEFLQLFLSPTLVSATSRELFGEDRSPGWTTVISGQDPLVLQLGLALRAAVQDGAAEAHIGILAKALVAHLLSRPFEASDPFEALTSAIKLRVSDPWSVEEMADFAGLSRHHFTRRFHEQVGLAPHQFLLEARMGRAAELLTGSNRTVAQIAQEVGFAHQGQLGYHFKRRLGRSPRDFRRGARSRQENAQIR